MQYEDIWKKVLRDDEKVDYEFSIGSKYRTLGIIISCVLGALLLPAGGLGVVLIIGGLFYYGFYLKAANAYAFTNKRILIHRGCLSGGYPRFRFPIRKRLQRLYLCASRHTSCYYRIMLREITFNIIRFVVIGAAVIAPVAMSLHYQRNRSRSFYGLLQDYNLWRPTSDELPSPLDPTTTHVVRAMHGHINGKQIFVGDCLFSPLLRYVNPTLLCAIVPDAFLSPRTVIIVDGIERGLAGSFWSLSPLLSLPRINEALRNI